MCHFLLPSPFSGSLNLLLKFLQNKHSNVGNNNKEVYGKYLSPRSILKQAAVHFLRQLKEINNNLKIIFSL